MTGMSGRVPRAAVIDAFVVVMFVSIGRRNHDESGALSGVLGTALPFLIGLGVAWIVARAWRRPDAVLTGATIWPVTVLVGMLLRNLVFDRGTALSFVIVATVFLAATLIGWRALLRLLPRRSGQSSGALTAR